MEVLDRIARALMLTNVEASMFFIALGHPPKFATRQRRAFRRASSAFLMHWNLVQPL